MHTVIVHIKCKDNTQRLLIEDFCIKNNISIEFAQSKISFDDQLKILKDIDTRRANVNYLHEIKQQIQKINLELKNVPTLFDDECKQCGESIRYARTYGCPVGYTGKGSLPKCPHDEALNELTQTGNE